LHRELVQSLIVNVLGDKNPRSIEG
jgi:hypothetical protein